ncbi:MAG: methyltransferase domain-containing protein [Acidobacteria bacterium]|nr:methyltransferase domain-containing protein [Acidobacteriota bacterium]
MRGSVSNFYSLVRRDGEIKFGNGNEEAISKYIDYWTDTLTRNQQLVSAFRSRTKIDFQGKTVLDVGCGTGGMSQIITEEHGYYIGCDLFSGILEMAQAFISDLRHAEKAGLVRASGTHIPLADGSVDIVIAFDVIEHLEGGYGWQRSFLREIRRVLRPNGILLLTTPNRLHPFEGHTFMYGPHYLPVWLADRYIRWKNPSFLEEYRTYGQVKLLTPWKMKRLLDEAGLKLIHDFPWGKDLKDYPTGKRVLLRFLSKVGLGWIPPKTFWVSACREERTNEWIDNGDVRPPQISDVAYTERFQKEIECYKSVENVHDLPEIFHFWSNRYVRPKVEAVFGVVPIEEFYAKYIFQYGADHPGKRVEVASIGAGNSDMEVRIAKLLRDRGFNDFRFRCLDINPDMLDRGRNLASQEQLGDYFDFLQVDIGDWQPERTGGVVVMAHHSLHHLVKLEEIFANVKKAIGDDGYFLVWDMIGRNGHMRWPEALAVINDIWQTMPDRYKYNHQLKRFEKVYDNWDCSKEGFEGIRAQDILPLLLKNFHFEAFIAFGNLPDVFVDRSFGHNFDVNNPEDIEFVDRIGSLSDRLISDGVIKPTQMVGVLRGRPTGKTRCYEHWTPEFCLRSI